MYDLYSPCEKHELAFCGECSGAARAYDESLQEERGPLDSSDLPPGVAYAQYPGQCADYGRESPIRYDDHAQGWVATACCG